MDPDENLRQQLQLAGAIIHLADEDYDATDDAVRLAELVQAMNDWIQRGGFLPKRWTPRQNPRRPVVANEILNDVVYSPDIEKLEVPYMGVCEHALREKRQKLMRYARHGMMGGEEGYPTVRTYCSLACAKADKTWRR